MLRLHGSRKRVALCIFLLSGSASAKGIDRYAASGWTLSIRHDRFANRTFCDLRSSDRHILYQPAALGFRFRSRKDTLGAIYRIDGGEPKRWQDDYPDLIAAGAIIEGSGLDDPTDGIVWIPIEKVRSARVVTVRPAGRGQGRSFRLRGYAVMLSAAHRLGCTSDISFAS